MTDNKKIIYWYHDKNRKPDSKGYRKGNSRLKYNWHLIIPKIKEVLADRKSQELETTTRKLYYVLEKLEGEGVILPGIKKTYHALIAKMSELRYQGILPMDCVVDDRHHIVDINDTLRTPEDWIRYYSKQLLQIYKDYHVSDKYKYPRWNGQKNYVEIWIEKEADVSDLVRIIRRYDLQIRVLAFGGIAGTTTLDDCCTRLKDKIKSGKNIIILYFGDYDSTGEFIDRDIYRRLDEVDKWTLDDPEVALSLTEYAKKYKVKFKMERVAVTKEQIHNYELPWNPEKMSDEVQEKIEKDPRTASMVLREGRKYAASLDSFPALHLDEFETIVADAVNGYFDNNLYETELQRHKEIYPEEKIKQERNDWIEELYHMTNELGY